MDTLSTQFPEKPHQPRRFNFPKRAFGQTQLIRRSFQPCWFNTWTWLHYDEGNNTVVCFICAKAEHKNLLRSKCKDVAFISKGLRTGKTQPIAFVDTGRANAIWNLYK